MNEDDYKAAMDILAGQRNEALDVGVSLRLRVRSLELENQALRAQLEGDQESETDDADDS